MALNLDIHDETSPLETVILGIANDQGKPGQNNPKARYHLANGTYPFEEHTLKEVAEFEQVLLQNDVKVLRPENLPGINQIFTRDIGFVIDDYFIVANMGAKPRKGEIKGIETIIAQLDPNKILYPTKEETIEGGDVVLYGDKIFVGESKRTNDAGYSFIKKHFPNKDVIQIEITPSQNAEENILHLDCTFQPIGKDSAIVYEEGLFYPEKLTQYFNSSNLIKVSQKQAYRMFPNIFSISPDKIVIEKRFFELKYQLLDRGFEVIEVNYAETSKMSGLLRCSTLPLKRKY